MIIVKDPLGIDKLIQHDTGFLKFVSIGPVFVGVTMEDLIRSDDFISLPTAPLELTKDFLASLPPPTSPIQDFDLDMLNDYPVIMFETPEVDGLYWRFDGRHRCLGAAHAGYTKVPARWVKRSTWGRYIVGFKTDKSNYGSIPFVWERVPYLPESDIEGCHYEPNFELPEAYKFSPSNFRINYSQNPFSQTRKVELNKVERKSIKALEPSNAGMAMLLKPSKLNSQAKPVNNRSSELTPFGRNADLLSFDK